MKLTTMHYIGLAIAGVAIVYLLYTLSGSTLNPVTNFTEGFKTHDDDDEDVEGFEDSPETSSSAPTVSASVPSAPSGPVAPPAPVAGSEGFYGGYDRTVSAYASAGDGSGRGSVPSSDFANCYTRDGLNPTDLLPAPSAEASQFLASNPPTQGSPDSRNLLQAGYHIGIDTVSQSNKNPNLQLRSDPPIPRCGPQPIFNSSSIPATQNNRRVLEIGSELNPGLQ